MNEQQRDYAKAKQAKRRVEMKMEAREKSFLKGRGLMDSEGTEADSLYKIEDEALFDMACKEFDLLPGIRKKCIDEISQHAETCCPVCCKHRSNPRCKL